MKAGMNTMDRIALAISPQWALRRMRARAAAEVLARHYEAAATGRRTINWPRSHADANVASSRALAILRDHARDLARNNDWARNALRVIANNTIGWGIQAKGEGEGSGKALDRLWKSWAGTKACDPEGQTTFAGIQSLAMRSIAESGEVLIRRRHRLLSDGLPIPTQLQVMEPDYIDTSKDGVTGPSGGPIVQGVEFDRIGRRVAYWLFDHHPGSNQAGSPESKRVDAADIAHICFTERPGQVRGVTWFASAIVKLKDFDEYEDALLLRQKVAACFTAFVTDVDGAGMSIAEPNPADPSSETVEPGMIRYLKPGQAVEFGTPPTAQDDGFAVRNLRRIAAGIGVTYEDLTGDYSQVNFSSARMSRIAHWAHVYDWQWNMVVPRLCDRVWAWAMEDAENAGLLSSPPPARWTPAPMPMIEPDREALAAVRRIRGGLATLSEVIREQGADPDEMLEEYAIDMQRLDKLGIWLDSDVRRTSQAGLAQERVGGGAEEKQDSGEAP